jgi:hypothetical protein
MQFPLQRRHGKDHTAQFAEKDARVSRFHNPASPRLAAGGCRDLFRRWKDFQIGEDGRGDLPADISSRRRWACRSFADRVHRHDRRDCFAEPAVCCCNRRAWGWDCHALCAIGSSKSLPIPSETFGLLLLSVCGLMLAAVANDLWLMYVAAELSSLPFCVMLFASRQEDFAPVPRRNI